MVFILSKDEQVIRALSQRCSMKRLRSFAVTSVAKLTKLMKVVQVTTVLIDSEIAKGWHPKAKQDSKLNGILKDSRTDGIAIVGKIALKNLPNGVSMLPLDDFKMLESFLEKANWLKIGT